MAKVIILLSAAAATMIFMSWRRPVDPSQSGAAVADTGSRTSELDLLRGEVTRQSRDLSALQEAARLNAAHKPEASQPAVDALSDKKPSGALAAPSAPTRPSSFSPKALQAFEQGYRKYADKVFYAEAPDAQWRPDVQLSARMAKILPPGSTLNAIECRSTMCRFESSHADFEKYQSFLFKGFGPPTDGDSEERRPLWVGPTLFVRADDGPGGQIRSIGYLAREGHALPSPPRDELQSP
jgi:hypothetical protein